MIIAAGQIHDSASRALAEWPAYVDKYKHVSIAGNSEVTSAVQRTPTTFTTEWQAYASGLHPPISARPAHPQGYILAQHGISGTAPASAAHIGPRIRAAQLQGTAVAAAMCSVAPAAAAALQHIQVGCNFTMAFSAMANSPFLQLFGVLCVHSSYYGLHLTIT